MTGHFRTALKIKTRFFTSCFNRADDRAKLDY